MSSPHISAPNLISKLDHFAQLSGLIINSQKSTALNISLPSHTLQQAQTSLPFSWSTSHLTYLGITITPNLTEFFSANFPPLLKQITNLLKQWSSLPISWIGKINIIKMTILPKILYLFRVLPISVPTYFLRNLQRKTLAFIWGSLKHCVSKQTLYFSKLKGGLGFPNFASYYHAAQIACIPKYHAKYETPLWVAIEAIDCDPFSITNLIWSKPSDRKNIKNKITKHTITIWDKFKLIKGLQSPHVPLLSFIRNPLFYPACTFPNSFKKWISSNITQLCDMSTSTSLKTFPELCDRHQLPQSELFRYLQIKNFFMPYIQNLSKLDELTQFERICKREPHSKGLISIIYKHLITLPTADPPSYVEKWERDLGLQLESSDWDKIWTTTKSSSQNIIALETNYKVLLRWYLVPVRIAKYIPQYSPLCFRGCGELGSHIHIFWECPVTKCFWKEVFLILSTLFKKTIKPDPSIALLNLKPTSISHTQFKLLLQITTAAKQTIAKAWKTPTLMISETKTRINQAMTHSKTEAITNDNIAKFEKIWNPWVTHFFPPNFDITLLRPW